MKHLAQVYYEHGFLEMLQNASDQRHYVLSKGASIILKFVQTVHQLRFSFNPYFKKETKQVINTVSRTRNWLSSPVRCISWHPHAKKIAVALFDDSVKIFHNGVSTVTLLKTKYQKNITCLAWRPMCATDLAVGCEDGIIIWNVDPLSVVSL